MRMHERTFADPRCREIIEHWFGEASDEDCSLEALQARTKMWFFRNADTDATIRARFGQDVAVAARGEHDSWAVTAVGSLALVVLLDQFSRNMHRDDPLAFAQDTKALTIALTGLDRRFDAELSAGERLVYYLPLMHAEDIAIQERATELYRQLAEDAPVAVRPELVNAHAFAKRHRDVVARFGRFPHRNKTLGRASTEEEIAFLKQPGSSF